MNTTGSITQDLSALKTKIKTQHKVFWGGVPMAYRCMYRLLSACVGLVMLALLAGEIWLVWCLVRLVYFSQFSQALSAWVSIPMSICAAVFFIASFAIAHDAIMGFVEKRLDRLAEKIKAAVHLRKSPRNAP